MDYNILHHSPGRIRFQIPRLRQDVQFGQTLENLILGLPVILGARMNRAAASLVVQYYSPGLEKEQAEHLIHQCITKATTTDRLTPPLALPIPPPRAIRDWEAEVEAERPRESDWERLGWPWISLSLALLAAPLEIPPLVVGLAVVAGAWPWWQRTQTRWETEQAISGDFLDSLWLALHTLNGEFVAPALKTSLAGARADVRDRLTEFMPYPDVLSGSGQLFTVEAGPGSDLVSSAEIRVGDRLWIEAGQVMPVDGSVVAGTGVLGLVDQDQQLTTITVQPEQFVYAGGQLLSGRILVEAKRLGWQTRIGLVTELRQAEPVYDSYLAQAQAHVAHQAVIPTLAVAGCLGIATGTLAPALAPLQLDFGSGIQLSLRPVFLRALIAATQAGVYIPSAASLERLAQLRWLVVDIQGLGEAEKIALKPLAQAMEIRLIWIETASELELTKLSQLENGVGILLGPEAPLTYPESWLRIYWDAHVVDPQAPDIVLLEPTVTKLGIGLSIAHQALERIYQNTALILIPNVIVVSGGILTGLSPVVNVLTNNVTAFWVEFGPQPEFGPPKGLSSAPASSRESPEFG